MSSTIDVDLSRYTTLFDAQSEYQDEWEKNEDLYLSLYSQKEWNRLKKKRRSKHFIPVIQNTVDIIESIFSTAFFSAGCPIELQHKDPEVKRKLNLIVKYFYGKYEPEGELTKAFRSSLLFRMGVVSTFWDNQKKRVITRQVPVTDIAFDDECTGIEDLEDFAFKSVESIRKLKFKIKTQYYNEKNLLKKLSIEDEKESKRVTRKHYYSYTAKGKLLEKIFIKDILVRKKILKKNPFQYGFAINELASVKSDKRDNQILCYGGSLPQKIKRIQRELNQKRNLKNDIQEKILNPDVYVGDGAKVDPKDLTYGSGKRIRIEGKIDQIKERQVPGEYSLTQDVQILKGDLRDASGVNSIQEGQTGGSDRRSKAALSVINANSSMRIQQMINLTDKTLFVHWAKTWVYLTLQNADDEIINELTNSVNPFGPKGNRKLDYSLKTNFGMTVDKEARISDLVNVLQMLAPDQSINADVKEKILKEFLNLRLGDDIDLEDVFVKQASKPTEEEDVIDNTPKKTADASML